MVIGLKFSQGILPMNSVIEEIEVLNSIYPNEIKFKENKGEIEIIIHESLEPLLFEFTFSKDPNSIPSIYTNANWLDGSEISKIKEKLESMFEKQPIIYNWIQWMKENLFEYLDIQSKIKEEVLERESFELEEKSKIKIITTDSISMNKSKFVAHIAKVYSMDDVDEVLTHLYKDKKIANATHNIYALRFKKDGEIHEKNRDDGETGASQPMLFLLQRLEMMNCIVIVTRWYGGVHLGSDRFKIINNLTRLAIEQYPNL